MLVEAEISINIRKIRRSKGLTLDDIARKTGFTKGYLSKVENSDKAPPLSTLLNIAKSLGVNISELLGDGAESISFSLVKKNERQMMARDGTVFGYSFETLAHSYPNKGMEPYILTIPRNIKKSPLFQHEGEEMLMVLEGTLRFIHGDQEYLVEEGDCIYFDSGFPHRGFCEGEKPVKCLIVMSKP